MRTNDPRVVPSIRFLGYLSAAAAIGLALAACSSSTHLDPPGAAATGTGGAAASTTTGSGGGSGGAAPMACRSNPDCETYPKSICDAVKSECVECLVDSDCAQKSGPACFNGACGCPIKGQAFCPTPSGTSKQCVDTATAQNDCGSCGHVCFGACTVGKCADAWEPTSLVGAPEARAQHVAVWADSKMIVWGGRVAGGGATATGGVYDPKLNTWTTTSMANVPSARVDAGAVWDDKGKRMIVWGGRSLATGLALNTGALYDPEKNAWETLAVKSSSPPAASDTPTARWGHTALWTGTGMIVFGGTDTMAVASNGAILNLTNPAAPTWESVPAIPGHRSGYAAAWTDTNLFVWGGVGSDDGVTPDAALATGATYTPGAAGWVPVVAAPLAARSQASAVWNGISTVVWGGVDAPTFFDTGAKYTAGGGWFSINNPAPTGRIGHSAVMVKTASAPKMIIWGGQGAAGFLDSGYTFDGASSSLDWSVALPTAPVARARHTTVVNGKDGSKMIIWGGEVSFGNGITNSGAIFDASSLM